MRIMPSSSACVSCWTARSALALRCAGWPPEGSVTIATVGGYLEPGEDPLPAAKRELLEETGCECAALQLIGTGSPDPARMSCRAYYFLATGCVETAVPAWDEHEEMELLKLPIAQVKKMLFAGEIVDSVQQSALFYALRALGELGS